MLMIMMMIAITNNKKWTPKKKKRLQQQSSIASYHNSNIYKIHAIKNKKNNMGKNGYKGKIKNKNK